MILQYIAALSNELFWHFFAQDKTQMTNKGLDKSWIFEKSILLVCIRIKDQSLYSAKTQSQSTNRHLNFTSDGSSTFNWTSNELKHYFAIIERIRTFSSIVDRTPYFWVWMIEHWTSNLIGLLPELLNYLSNWLIDNFFEHQTYSNLFIRW